MEFGIVMALLHLGIVSFCTILLILSKIYEKRQEKREREKLFKKAA